jgi:phosphoribosylanthranilate isomerase
MSSQPAHIVKICGVTNPDDALAALQFGANSLGFNFYPKSPRCISPLAAAQIATLAPNALKAGVFVNEDPARVAEICRFVSLDLAQLHGGAPPANLPYWRACRVPVAGGFLFPDEPNAQAFLLDTASETLPGGTGQSFPWTAARTTTHRVIVAGGLSAANVHQAIRESQPWGVDACSRIESTPGRKDHRKMKEFIQAALAAFESC